MRIIEADQNEFPQGPSSEEFIRICTHKIGLWPYQTIEAFSVAISEPGDPIQLGEPTNFNTLSNSEVNELVSNLERFAGIQLSPKPDWTIFVLENEWNEYHYLIVTDEIFLSYYWATAA